MKKPVSGKLTGFSKISDIRKRAGNSDAEQGSQALIPAPLRISPYCHYYNIFGGKSQYENKEFKPIWVVIQVGFLCVVLCSWRYTVKLRLQVPPEYRSFGELRFSKTSPVVGIGVVYPFRYTEPIKKSHATEPFEKEDRLGAAEPCLFGANIVANRERFCQVYFYAINRIFPRIVPLS